MGEEKLFKSEQNVSPLIWQVGEIAFKGALWKSVEQKNLWCECNENGTLIAFYVHHVGDTPRGGQICSLAEAVMPDILA